MNQPAISVVICAYTIERLRDIHEAVDSVLRQTYTLHEVIVAVDHNEELLRILRAELPTGVKVVLNKSARGLSETRNVGIRSSAGEIVAFIDDDAVAERHWLDNLAMHYCDPEVVAVGGRAVPMWLDGGRPSWFPEELDWVVGCTYKGLPLNGNEVRNMIGCNMSFRRYSFEQAGFFTSKVGRIGKLQGVGEEAELCLRIKHSMLDACILYEPDAVIYHKVPSWRVTPKYLIQRSYNEGLYKTIVKKLSSNSSAEPLSTENSYLHYLLFKAIPLRLGCFYCPWSLVEAGAIVASIVATGVGYVKGETSK